jgi:2-polyprenyl-6-methoxyphenol hydroxylase-like FAD-dependent oxidoreductase
MHAELGAADRSSSPLRGALLVKNHPVVIAGAGIGGLATALTLHQIGVESLVLESVREMRPLGVGLNLQPNAVRLGARVSGYRRCSDDRVMVRSTHPDGFSSEMEGKLLIGADGIHSPVRAQMHPGQPPIHWGGKMMWRGVTRARPIRTGASFIGLGTHEHRFVF